MIVDRNGMINCLDLAQSGVEDSSYIEGLCLEARRFVSSFKWCKRVLNAWLADGFRHAAIFWMEIEPSGDADSFVWIIVGDIPPAYIDPSSSNHVEALASYCWWMKQWVEAVRLGQTTEDLMPVVTRETYEEVKPSRDNAEMLDKRLRLIVKELVIPYYAKQSSETQSLIDEIKDL